MALCSNQKNLIEIGPTELNQRFKTSTFLSQEGKLYMVKTIRTSLYNNERSLIEIGSTFFL